MVSEQLPRLCGRRVKTAMVEILKQEYSDQTLRMAARF